jgi:hypothetical protein
MRKTLLTIAFLVLCAAPAIAQQTVNTELPAAAALADNAANPTTPLIGAAMMCYDGSTWDRCTADTQGTHDTALGTITSVTGGLLMGRASAAAPTDVSADGDAVIPWYLRSGALSIQPTFGGVLGVAGNGASGTGVQRVTLANDSTGVLATVSTVTSLSQLGGVAVPVEDAAETAAGTGIYAMTVRRDTAASSAGTTGDNATANTDALGLLWTRGLDPCSGVAKQYIPINISTATTTELTASLAGASTHYYVCSINIGPVAGAQNIALVDDDTDNCASVTSGLAGGTTAGSGWNIAANGGLTFGNGSSSIARTGGTNRVLCAVTSAAVQTSGVMTVVAAP